MERYLNQHSWGAGYSQIMEWGGWGRNKVESTIGIHLDFENAPCSTKALAITSYCQSTAVYLCKDIESNAKGYEK